MPIKQNTGAVQFEIARHLGDIRRERRWTQAELASRCGLSRQEYTYFESGARRPNTQKLLQIARALDLSLQRLLYGADRPGRELKDIAVELRTLGLIDLWIEGATIPGALRRNEEIIGIALFGDPPPRILEGLPAVLAWNEWNGGLLRAFAKENGQAVVVRLAWLADIVLALDRQGGFPGGCPGRTGLAAYLKLVKPPRHDRWDDLGHATLDRPKSPIWKRWRISYAAELRTFRDRAEALRSLADAEGRPRHTQRSSNGKE